MNLLVVNLVVLLSALSSLSASFTDYFSCMDAAVNEPLPGHILKVGKIITMDGNAVFIFPEQGSEELAQIPIDNTVGIIGSDEDGLARILSTPMNNSSYVVAQIFVGDDENQPPAVSCVSMAMPVSNYDPVIYGADYGWLARPDFVRMLRYTKYRPWNWRIHNDRFRDVRKVYYGKRNRFHDDVAKRRPHGMHKRPLKMMEKKMDDTKKIERNTKLPMKVEMPTKAPVLDNLRKDMYKDVNRQKPALQPNKKPIVLPNS